MLLSPICSPSACRAGQTSVCTIGLAYPTVLFSQGLSSWFQFEPCELREEFPMAQGTIKKLAEKGFGFIASDKGDVFFHLSSLAEGVQFEDLQVNQKVEYEIGQGPKGPRAENVRFSN